MDMFRIFSFFFLIIFAYAKNEVYDGHVLFEVEVENSEQAQYLHDLEDLLGVDIWAHPLPTRPGQVLVPGNRREDFQDVAGKAGFKSKVIVENIKELIALEEESLAKAASKPYNRSVTNGLPFDRIYTYSEVNAFLEDLANAYPNLVTLENAGQSFEGRDMKYLKISTTNFQDTNKPIVYMQSLLHAREWVTLPATLYAIHKLVINVSEQDLLQNIDWIILPIANPDGYEFTHTSSRFWRKNRATGYMITNLCSGVDLNRNFDFGWSTASSGAVCSDTFHGRSAFSEPETANIRDILAQYSDRAELFLDIHSFGSMILYGFGTGGLPPNGLIINLVGVQMAQAIDAVKVPHNPNYIVGNIVNVLYPASGGASDYGWSTGIPLSYTFELPGHRLYSNTVMGFLVEDNFIEQAGFETWEGIKVGARYALNNFRSRRGI